MSLPLTPLLFSSSSFSHPLTIISLPSLPFPSFTPFRLLPPLPPYPSLLTLHPIFYLLHLHKSSLLLTSRSPHLPPPYPHSLPLHPPIPTSHSSTTTLPPFPPAFFSFKSFPFYSLSPHPHNSSPCPCFTPLHPSPFHFSHISVDGDLSDLPVCLSGQLILYPRFSLRFPQAISGIGLIASPGR